MGSYESYKDVYMQQIEKYIHFSDFAKIVEIDRLTRYDKNAVDSIADLENIIEMLQEYRKDLAIHAQNILNKDFIIELRFTRDYKYYDKRIFYYIEIYKIFDGGGEIQQFSKTFTGKERKQAFLLYIEMKKQYNGIKTVEKLEKSRWEK